MAPLPGEAAARPAGRVPDPAGCPGLRVAPSVCPSALREPSGGSFVGPRLGAVRLQQERQYALDQGGQFAGIAPAIAARLFKVGVAGLLAVPGELGVHRALYVFEFVLEGALEMGFCRVEAFLG